MKFKKKINPKIFWVGPFIPSKYIKNWLASSPAALKWQKHLVTALIKEEVDIEWLYYRPEFYWPKGRLIPSSIDIPAKIVKKNNQINYFNTIGLRNFTLKRSLLNILDEKIKENSSQKLIIVSYNGPKWIKKIFLNKKIRLNFKCIYIVADEEVPPGADGYVFLSHYSFKNYNKNLNKLHLDGAVYPSSNSFKIPKKNKNKIIFFYSGSFYDYTGVKLLLEAVELLTETNFELWISGSGNDNFLKRAMKKDQRIKYFGLLTDNQLKKTYSKADIFINPRPVNIKLNNISFPSKLFDYLFWNKPIISTCTKSLCPNYKKILHIVDDDPVSIALGMRSYLEGKKFSKIPNKKWVLNKNWQNEGIKFKNFLQKLV